LRDRFIRTTYYELPKGMLKSHLSPVADAIKGQVLSEPVAHIFQDS
jgi:hypothetical protein